MKLHEWNQWLLWTFDSKGAKRPLNKWGEYSGSTRTADFVDWPTVRDSPLGVQGPAFCFTPDDPFVGIDLDDCLDESQQPKDWVLPILEKFSKTYLEVSPSLTGIKIYAIGSALKAYSNQTKAGDGAIEVYDSGRFFTFTELQAGDASEVVGCDDEILWLYETYWPKAPAPRSVEYRTVSSSLFGLEQRAADYVANCDKPLPGERNNACFRVAGHLAALHNEGEALTEAKVLEFTNLWNDALPEPLPEAEVESVVKSALNSGTPREKKDGGFTVEVDNSVDLSGILAPKPESELKKKRNSAASG